MKLSQRVNRQMEQVEKGELHFTEEFDVIVVGLGTAGAIAAITAARRGCKVLGLESLHCMGGTHTTGAIQNYYFGSKGGLYESLDDQIREVEHDGYQAWGGTNGELKKLYLERNALEAGVMIGYESTVIGVYLENQTVKGLRWISPEGVRAAGSKIVIDCTGNAEVCLMAGCSVRQGRGIDGQGQPFSNVIETITKNRVGKFYTDSGYVDPNDGDDVSRAIIESATGPDHLKEHYGDNPKMLRLTPLLGVREGAFIVGEENVTLASFQNEKLTAEPAFYAYSNLDNHGKDVAFESTAQQDWIVGASLWGLNFSVPIPLGAMIPQGFEGLMAAGRCIALDHDIAACVRMNRDMQKCGEVAGLAATMAIEQSVPVRAVSYAELAAELRETGCLNEERLRFVDTSVSVADAPVASWLRDKAEIREGLAGEKPGIAIWSARRLGEQIISDLKAWITPQNDENLRRNSAFALALLGEQAALPLLRQMVRERDSYVPRTSRKYNQARGYAAIYLAGRLEDREIVPELLNVLENRQAISDGRAESEFISDDDELFCQYFTFSLMALLRIGEKHQDLRADIIAAVTEIISQPDFSLSVTLKGSKILRHSLVETVRGIVRRQAQQWQLPVAEKTLLLT